jgi:predicted ATPase
MLFDVPVDDALMESEARRFIALVDEFYERHVKLVVSAAVPLHEIYQGETIEVRVPALPVAPAGDAERGVSEAGTPGGVKPGTNHIKGSIFDPTSL